MSENLAGLLTETAKRRGDHVAFKLEGVELGYAMLDEASARVAALLKSKGLEQGDRVGLMLPNVPYFPVVYYGILRAGGVVVPMNVLLKEREVHFYLEDSGAKLLFAWHDFADAAERGAADARAECIRRSRTAKWRSVQPTTPRWSSTHPGPRAPRKAPSSPTRTSARTA